MRVFVGKMFLKWVTSEAISENTLCVTAREAFVGDVEGDLGGYLFKKRIARKGSGKSAGYRTIIGFQRQKDDRIFFLYGFGKNERANITKKERDALSLNAKVLVGTTDMQIDALKNKGTIAELECENA